MGLMMKPNEPPVCQLLKASKKLTSVDFASSASCYTEQRYALLAGKTVLLVTMANTRSPARLKQLIGVTGTGTATIPGRGFPFSNSWIRAVMVV